MVEEDETKINIKAMGTPTRLEPGKPPVKELYHSARDQRRGSTSSAGEEYAMA